jgi:hypothetical protein
MGTSNLWLLVPLFDLKFVDEVRRWYRRNFKSAALAARSQSEFQILNSTGFYYSLVVL